MIEKCLQVFFFLMGNIPHVLWNINEKRFKNYAILFLSFFFVLFFSFYVHFVGIYFILLLMVLSFKVIFNHTSKREFVVLHFHTYIYVYLICILCYKRCDVTIKLNSTNSIRFWRMKVEEKYIYNLIDPFQTQTDYNSAMINAKRM